MNRFRRFAPAAAALLVAGFFLATPSLAASDRWFHVRVDEAHGAEVAVNLPLNLIEMAFDMIPDDLSQDLEVELNEQGFSLDQLRTLWNEVRAGGDATYVTVRDGDDTVEVRKEGNYLVARTAEGSSGDTSVDVRFPMEVIDALFSGPPDRLDFAAAIRALADYSDGDMVTVRDGETIVRVWVDDTNEGRAP
ncbi:MAG TPA: hypothetical protein VMT85_11845 [Thermoanaerobaculia bacterium]|nr:hypothetical protein [Thermoanaerobaculia bacterium]